MAQECKWETISKKPSTRLLSRPAQPAVFGPFLVNEAEKDNEDDKSHVDILKEELKVADNRDNEKSKADLKDDDDEDDRQQEEERARRQMLEEKYWNILKKAKAEAAKSFAKERLESLKEEKKEMMKLYKQEKKDF
ncbi:hypothetical protein MHYP_G00151650 [Metynnis hypsauchen]